MALIFWTAAETALITKTFGATLKSFRPNIPQHHFIPWAEGAPPPEPGNGDVVIVAGTRPLDSLRAAGLAPKNRTVNSLREHPIKRGLGHYLVTFDPVLTQSEFDKREVMDWDVQLAHRLMTTGRLDPVVGDYVWVSSYKAMIGEIQAQYEKTGKAVELAFDTETMGLHPWYPEKDFVSLSFTLRPGRSEMLYLGPKKAPIELDHSTSLYDQLVFLLTSTKIKLRMANGKYDLIWIAEKLKIECTNFKFDTLLVGSLLDENRTNSLNLHAKVFTDIGGYDDCVTPDTRVCTADLRWVPIGQIVPGDKLLGFDEDVAPGLRRRMRIAEAISTKRLTKRGVKVKLDNGAEIKSSFDHGFLAHERVLGNGPYTWIRARELKPGARVMLVAPVETERQTKDAGYLAGLFDGEGYVSFQGFGLTSGISQKPGPVWDRYVELMQQHGLGGFYSMQRNGDGVHTSKLTGWPTLRMLQMFRPERLISKYPFDGKCVPSGTPKVRVQSVEWLEDIEVVSLTTSTHTFVAEGVASHNSFNRQFDKGKMETIEPEDLRVYQGGDTDSCYQVADILRDQLVEDPQLTNFYIRILHPAARAFEKVERRGILVDQERYAVLGQDLRKVIKESTTQQLSLLPAKMRTKYRNRIEDQLAQGKNPMLPSILMEYFFTPHGLNLKPKEFTGKTKAPSLKKSHLRQFAGDPNAAAMLAAMTEGDSAAKTLSTFVEGFLRHLRPDGLFHPSYMLFHGGYNDDEDDESGTVTGRLSAKDPAFQTLPKKTKWAKRIRECFIAPKGKVILAIDYSQGELKVVACVAHEKTMLASYEQGLDLHAVTGAKLAEVELAEFLKWKDAEDKALAELFDKHRGNAKPANFGLLYGMQVQGFMAYAWANYGIRLIFEEAEKMRNAFFELYPGLLGYHERQREIVRMTEMVRSPLGRIRHLPMIKSWDREVKSKAERQAINSPIQGCLADMMEWAIVLIDDAYPNGEIGVVGNIHDALIAYVPEDNVELYAGRAINIMSNLPFHEVGWKPQLKFTADAEAGQNLATMKKLKLATGACN